MLFSTIGASMIWPYLKIYVSETLDAPLTLVASLMTINSAMGLLAFFIAGPIIDRFGRKWVMVMNLLVNGLCHVFPATLRVIQLSPSSWPQAAPPTPSAVWAAMPWRPI